MKNTPFLLFLLPVFFVLHGYLENYGFVTMNDALLLALLYIACQLIIASISWLFYRNISASSFFAFTLMSYYFFFGSMQDFLRKYFAGSFVHRYSFILPVSFFFFMTMIILLKKKPCRPGEKNVFIPELPVDPGNID
jgi:hypothetical protein